MSSYSIQAVIKTWLQHAGDQLHQAVKRHERNII